MINLLVEFVTDGTVNKYDQKEPRANTLNKTFKESYSDEADE